MEIQFVELDKRVSKLEKIVNQLISWTRNFEIQPFRLQSTETDCVPVPTLSPSTSDLDVDIQGVIQVAVTTLANEGGHTAENQNSAVRTRIANLDHPDENSVSKPQIDTTTTTCDRNRENMGAIGGDSIVGCGHNNADVDIGVGVGVPMTGNTNTARPSASALKDLGKVKGGDSLEAQVFSKSRDSKEEEDRMRKDDSSDEESLFSLLSLEEDQTPLSRLQTKAKSTRTGTTDSASTLATTVAAGNSSRRRKRQRRTSGVEKKTNFSPVVVPSRTTLPLPIPSFPRVSLKRLQLPADLTSIGININVLSDATTSRQRRKVEYREVLECPHCQKKMISKSRLKLHIRVHTGEKPFPCPHCNKRMKSRGNLIAHLLTHTREKPYKCPHCPKRMSDKSGLIRHIRSHTGEQPFQCPQCPKKFSRSYNLRLHIRVHSSARPFRCYFCSRTFSQRSNVNVHLRRHTGEKPYFCYFCGSEFATSKELVSHIWTHTGECPYRCGKCSFESTSSQKLNNHLMRHHPH